MSTLSADLSRFAVHSGRDPVGVYARTVGNELLRFSSGLRGWLRAQDVRRELAALDLRLLDDVGLTPADRDSLLR